jgi:NAD(P)-dependent dehydrogenase (short-subunit alcohol dehydrogenase family)
MLSDRHALITGAGSGIGAAVALAAAARTSGCSNRPNACANR